MIKVTDKQRVRMSNRIPLSPIIIMGGGFLVYGFCYLYAFLLYFSFSCPKVAGEWGEGPNRDFDNWAPRDQLKGVV